jgi:hypothetical protein
MYVFDDNTTVPGNNIALFVHFFQCCKCILKQRKPILAAWISGIKKGT